MPEQSTSIGRVLRKQREQKAPDAVAAVRLPEHVLAAEGPDAFIATFVNECTTPLVTWASWTRHQLLISLTGARRKRHK